MPETELARPAGVALNPRHRFHREIEEDLAKTNLKLVSIEELHKIAVGITGEPRPIACCDRIVCVVEYRDGSVIDVIRQIKQD